MKKLFLIFVCCAMTTIVMAQPKTSFGVRAGMNISEVAATLNSDITSVWRVGFTGGLFANLRLSDAFALEADVLYSQQGVQYKNRHEKIDDGFKLYTNYINIPLLAKFYLTDRFNVLVGPQGSFLVKKKVTGLRGDEEYFARNAPNKAQIEMVLGGGYDVTDRLSFDLRYSIAVTQTYKKTDGLRLTNGHNSVIQMTAAYKF